MRTAVLAVHISFLRITVFILFVVGVAAPGEAGAQQLLGYEGSSASLFSIDASPPSAELLGSDVAAGLPSEIQISPGKTLLYAPDTEENELLHVLDPRSGSVVDSVTMSLPTSGFCADSPEIACSRDVDCPDETCLLSNVITALEFVGGTLYAGFTREGGARPSQLVAIEPATGEVTEVGVTGVFAPLGGLAYDQTSSTLFAISAGGTPAELFHVDRFTGAAQSIGLVTIGSLGVGGMTALTFGDDGVLYGLPNPRSERAGHLLSLNPRTATALDLGDLGVMRMNALALPEAGSWWAVLTALASVSAIGFARSRTKKLRPDGWQWKLGASRSRCPRLHG